MAIGLKILHALQKLVGQPVRLCLLRLAMHQRCHLPSQHRLGLIEFSSVEPRDVVDLFHWQERVESKEFLHVIVMNVDPILENS